MSQLGLSMKHEETPRRGRGGAAAALAAVVVVVLLGGVVFLAARWFNHSPDYSGPGSGEVVVQVNKGDSARQIGLALEKADVVRSADAFVSAAASDERSRGITPGFYRMRQQMSAADALDLMLDPKARISSRVTIPEGVRLQATLDLLAKNAKIPGDQLAAAAKDGASLGLPAYAKGNTEGFLFPATYDIQPNATAQTVLTTMVSRFDQSARAVNLEATAADVGLTPYQVVIMASIVQAEGQEGDWSKIARVIYNRLAIGMPLQLDTTVLYALGKSTLNVSIADTQVDSPYNTYKIKGLPPGPIDSPGEQALDAVLHPADGNWLYFVTTDPSTGETKFTASYNEFLQFKAELEANTK